MPTNIGSFTIFGAIEQKWLERGGAGGLLGVPLSNESPTFDGLGRAQTFQRGVISWHPTIGAHEVHGAILARWLETGREQFGYPITDESPCPDNIGRFNHFTALQFPGPPESSIYWSPTTGPHDVFGAIRDKWASLGFERGVLGYPLESEHDQPGGGRVQRFQGGLISWTPAGGPVEHFRAINPRLRLEDETQQILVVGDGFSSSGVHIDFGFQTPGFDGVRHDTRGALEASGDPDGHFEGSFLLPSDSFNVGARAVDLRTGQAAVAATVREEI